MSDSASSRHVERAASNSLIEKLARAGYAVKGVVYALVGVLAVRAAFGAGGQTTGTEGAISSIAGEPFGEVLLWLIAIGLVGYSLWRFVQAVGDPDHKGSDAEGIIKRLGYAGSGVLYGLLAYSTFQILLGNGGGSSGGNASDWTATLMEQPFGVWLVGLAGVGAIALGIRQAYKGYQADFFDKFKTGAMGASERTWTRRTGQFGLIARGVVFGVIGVFLIRAALQTDPSEARGLGGALDALAAQSYGPYLLAAVALGLIAYGAYCLLNARYRQIGDAPS